MQNLTRNQVNHLAHVVRRKYPPQTEVFPLELLLTLVNLGILTPPVKGVYNFTEHGVEVIEKEMLLLRRIQDYMEDIDCMERRKEFIAVRTNTIAFETDNDYFKIGKNGFNLNREDIEITMLAQLKSLSVSFHTDFIEQTKRLITKLSESRLNIAT